MFGVSRPVNVSAYFTVTDTANDVFLLDSPDDCWTYNDPTYDAPHIDFIKMILNGYKMAIQFAGSFVAVENNSDYYILEYDIFLNYSQQEWLRVIITFSKGNWTATILGIINHIYVHETSEPYIFPDSGALNVIAETVQFYPTLDIKIRCMEFIAYEQNFTSTETLIDFYPNDAFECAPVPFAERLETWMIVMIAAAVGLGTVALFLWYKSYTRKKICRSIPEGSRPPICKP